MQLRRSFSYTLSLPLFVLTRLSDNSMDAYCTNVTHTPWCALHMTPKPSQHLSSTQFASAMAALRKNNNNKNI